MPVLQLRDREMELRAQISAITSSSKEGEQAEAEAGEGTGPQVNDQHIADIVAQWTGIPIDKVHLLLKNFLDSGHCSHGMYTQSQIAYSSICVAKIKLL